MVKTTDKKICRRGFVNAQHQIYFKRKNSALELEIEAGEKTIDKFYNEVPSNQSFCHLDK